MTKGKRMNKPVFKTQEARQKIIDYYKNTIALLPVEYTEQFIETSYGTTYTLKAGSRQDKAIVLLHGSVSNSAMWIGDIPRLAQDYYVVCIDIIGEAGNSQPNRYSLKNSDYALWLSEVLDGIGFEKVAIAGNSLGGWLALKFASSFPEKVISLILIAPSGIVGAKLSFVLKSIASISRGEKRLLQFLEYVYGTKDIPEQVVEYTRIMMEGFNPMVGGLPIFTYEQLSRINMPILFIAGENDVTMNSSKAADRLSRLGSNVEIMLIESGGHAIYNEAEVIADFLKREDE